MLSALPMPQRWLDVMVYVLVKQGHGLLGLGLLVAFAGCLRASELCGLYGADILLPDDSRDSHGVCGLRLRQTKTGPNKFARVRDPAVIAVLRFLKAITPTDSKVFMGVTGQRFNSLLRLACDQLGLSVVFTMHSLRHGAATMRFLGGDSPESIRIDGRWASANSMETYLQACAALLLTLSCSPKLLPIFDRGPTIRSRILRYL